MKLAVALCVALLFVAFAQTETEPPNQEEHRISGGEPAMPKEFPFVAYVKSGEGEQLIWNCVGSLITRSAVLTTGWCVRGFDKHTIRLGSIYRTLDDPNAWTVVSTWSLCHPDYKPPNVSSNVGIIFLPQKAPLNEYIGMVELPIPPNDGSFVGERAKVFGWGQTSEGSALSEVLNWANVTVLPNNICKQHFLKEWVIDSKLCAGGQHVMDGDDGAPLVTSIEGRFVQIGIHSRRERTHYNESRTAIYERVTFFTEWITNVTADSNFTQF